jgi:hypothetical protein
VLGPAAASNDLSGMTNVQVAVYQRTFKVKGVKIDTQVMATALAAYATSSNLAATRPSRTVS